MSDEKPGTAPEATPQPEPIRFFGTTWVEHDHGYGWRRAGTAAGSLLAAAAGALVLRFGFQGLADADIGPFVTVLAFAGFALCSALAFQRKWQSFTRRPAEDTDTANPSQSQNQNQNQGSLYAIGFIGALLAYFVRALIEAPGEALHRAEYDAARERHARRRATRTGNPAARKGKSGGKRKVRS